MAVFRQRRIGGDITGTIDLTRYEPRVFSETPPIQTLRTQLTAQLEKIANDKGVPVKVNDYDPLSFVVELIAYESIRIREEINRQALLCMVPYASGARLDQLLLLLGVERLRTEAPDGTLLNLESDEAFLRRALLAPDRFSTAGAEGSYKFHSYEALRKRQIYAQENEIKETFYELRDVKASSTTVTVIDEATGKPMAKPTGDVIVKLLFRPDHHAELKDPAFGDKVIKIVSDYLNADDIRPLTDSIDVSLATIEPVELGKVNVYVPLGVDPTIVRQEIIKSFEEYRASIYRIGAPVTVSAIHASLFAPDVYKVELVTFKEDKPGDPTKTYNLTYIEVKDDLDKSDIKVVQQ